MQGSELELEKVVGVIELDFLAGLDGLFQGRVLAQPGRAY